MRTIDNAFDAFWFLYNHPKSVEQHYHHPLTYRGHFDGQFISNLDIMFVKIDPVTRVVEDDTSRNTLVQVWLETGGAEWSDHAKKYITNTHDPLLDVGGNTFEEALIRLANRVLKEYGDYDETV